MKLLVPRLAVSMVIVLAACSAPALSSPGSGPSMDPQQSQPDPPASATGAPDASGSMAPTPSEEADALLDLALTDVRSGESFTLAELAATDGPVLLETMAIWCSNCRAQQVQVSAAHGTGSFTSVSLDVDLSEAPDDLAAYADREGFDWHFAMADASLYRLLQERFGVAVTNPPSTPLIVIERDGSVRPLGFGEGIRSADELLAELGAG
jgi:thiol-disulfide isomerase/thioredoxin